MNVLDENIVAQQCEQLRKWRIPFRPVGRHLSTHGALDENLIPLLHQLPQPTFFTQDETNLFETQVTRKQLAAEVRA